MTKILLVDDDDSCAEMLTKALAAFGYEVERAHNGQEALRLYTAQTVDLVLTDLFMPGMDGMELIMELEKLDPSVRIIAMSGGGLGDSGAVFLPTAERLGAVKTLAKPFPLESLRAAVRECLDTP
ncbi:MAG: response regulator [Limisphaerales bacterium]